MLAYTGMRNKWVEIVVGGFAVGVFASSFFPIGFSLALFFLLAAGALLAFGVLIPSQNRIWFLYLPVVLAALIGGIARYELSQPAALVLDEYVGNRVVADGTISSSVDERDTVSYLTVRLKKISVFGKERAISERIRVAVDRHSDLKYGDRISFSGIVREPENFTTNSGRIFDYRSYLAKDGIYHEMFRPNIELLSRGEGSAIVARLFRFKSALLSSITQAIPEPQSALLGGLILGEKHSLGDALTDLFRRSGLVHIIVLSGFNMTIIAAAIMWLTKRFPRALSASAGALGIIAFVIMAGMSATAMRAGLMALLAVLAKFVGRDYRIERALAVAAFLMVAQNPKVLAFDPSFQLSFLATLGLIYLSPFFEKWFKWITPRWGLREIVSATFATQLFVLPLLVNMSGTVSLIGVLANIIVLPLVPVTMLFGALTAFAGLLSTVIAVPFAYLAYALLVYITSVASALGGLPFSSVSVPAFPMWFIAFAYAALLFWVYWLHQRSKLGKISN